MSPATSSRATFGWGLRIDSARSRLLDAVTAFDGDRRDPAARDALCDIGSALTAGNWKGDGSVKDTPRVLGLLGSALAALERSTADSVQLQQAIVSVASDLAQAAVLAGRAPSDWATLIADADHLLLTGSAAPAYALLVRVAD